MHVVTDPLFTLGPVWVYHAAAALVFAEDALFSVSCCPVSRPP